LLTVGVDARSLEEQRTGIGRYLENLLRAWAVLGADLRFHVYTIGPPPSEAIPFVPCRVAFEDAHQPHLFSRELERRPVDVFFSPLYELPEPIDSPSVITVHDLVHEATPDAFLPIQLAYLRAKHLYALARADRIITDSAFIRAEISEWGQRSLGRSLAEKLSVIPLAADPRFTSGTSHPHGVPEPYLLYVGSIARKRHVQPMLDAFARSQRLKAFHFVVVGQNFLPEGEPLALPERAVHLPYVSNDRLVSLYRGARGFVYLSTYEGFGMPPLEAMACGAPVLAARAASVPEIVGDAALLVDDPTDALELRAALEDLALSDPSERIARGFDRAAAYSWEHTAAETLKVIVKARSS